jgi:hypothetical protein
MGAPLEQVVESRLHCVMEERRLMKRDEQGAHGEASRCRQGECASRRGRAVGEQALYA